MKVSEILKIIEKDGWRLIATKGSHRQFKHAFKPGCVTVPGKPSDDLAIGTQNSVLKQAGLKWGFMRYAVVIEKAVGNYSAYAPDLPGCIATGKTMSEVEAEISEAIAFHIEGMIEDGLSVPPPASHVEYVEVAA